MTTHTILGFNFYIQWDEEGKQGIDQHWHIWHDRAAPVPENQEIINIILDTYNQIKEMQKPILLNKYEGVEK